MSLSSLIVQREVATIREIEEALARQVLYGGDFVTNLFEVSRIEESALMPVVAESFGLPPAPLNELPKIPADAVRLVAAEVAMERGLAPLSIGASLIVAVAEPLSRDAEQELTFVLAIPIEQRIAPLFRIRQALSRDYGVPIDKRTARLITKVINKGPRMASTFPPPRESQPAFKVPPRPPSIAPPPAAPKSAEAPRTQVAPEGTLVRMAEAPPARPLRRRRGPLTMDVAHTELEASAERDVIFDVLFEFARQFFDYTALFIVHGEIAEGRDAFGEGSARDKVARIGVPLDLPNVLTTSRNQRNVVRSRPSKEGLDPVLMADLGRDGNSECIVFPVIVRTRVVALLFGDGGATGIDLAGTHQVEELVVAGAGAFERVIVRRKLKGAEAPAEGGAIAAKKKAESIAPPPTQVSEALDSLSPVQGSVRPAIEELAPPIRDLFTEPVSRVAMTTREPTAHVAGDPQSVRSDRPPPANLLAVRRPAGNPIPREEPEGVMPLGVAPRDPRRLSPPKGVSRTKSGGHKRAEAPAFEFGSPSMPSVVTENAFGSDAVERQLLAQIQGAPGTAAPSPPPVGQIPSASPLSPPADSPPRTTRDPQPAGWSREPSSPPAVHPWASAGDDTVISNAHALISSPKAASPPPMRAAPITDMSPQPILPLSSGPITPITDPSPPTLDFTRAAQHNLERAGVSHNEEIRGSRSISDVPRSRSPAPPAPTSGAPVSGSPTSGASRTLVAGEAPMLEAVVENAAPVSPLVVVTPDREMYPIGTLVHVAEDPPSASRDHVDDADTPIAPPVFSSEFDSPSSGTGGPEPVLSLAQRKGAPPIVMPPHEKKPMPPSEQQISVSAHRPPSSRSDHTRILPSVIVDVSSEYVTLVERVLAGHDEEAETDLTRAGGYAMPAIMAKFPGPILIEDDRLSSGLLPRVAECGPVIRLIASQRRTALPFVLAHVGSSDTSLRFWATYLLTELVYPDAIDAAIGRIFDDSATVRHAARAAIRALAEAHPQPVIERLDALGKDEKAPLARRILALEALGETREPLAVTALLSSLAGTGSGSDVAVAARHALVMITRQDFGLDPKKWNAWWDGNKERHRLEWLIDALMHEQRALRGAASDELRTITKEYFAYYDDLPKRERERAQARYRDWWETVGRVRFSRAATRGA
jgi:hypothetical protein